MVRIALSILVFPVVYLMGSFIAWDLNAGDWDPFGRVMTMALAVWAAFGVSLFGPE